MTNAQRDMAGAVTAEVTNVMAGIPLQRAVGGVAAMVDMGIGLHAVSDGPAALQCVRVVTGSTQKGAEDHCEQQEREKFDRE
ncbi:hypothetical protein [Geomonas azotofigens]|uniref:hypothetical protein n=1 Tax=Geomonas azotofigens TaxID=2843196 RepID=UPI001C124445|nr:hypothetical protein [Geomonas azotofigens]MBU5613578.1 hypothetical protein [Geomonas azotofigens]